MNKNHNYGVGIPCKNLFLKLSVNLFGMGIGLAGLLLGLANVGHLLFCTATVLPNFAGEQEQSRRLIVDRQADWINTTRGLKRYINPIPYISAPRENCMILNKINLVQPAFSSGRSPDLSGAMEDSVEVEYCTRDLIIDDCEGVCALENGSGNTTDGFGGLRAIHQDRWRLQTRTTVRLYHI